MSDKRSKGQYYTVYNPFTHCLFKEWFDQIDDKRCIIEPFAGSNNIPRLMNEAGYSTEWVCYDIDPSADNTYPNYPVEFRDTIADFPEGFSVCVTNPPYLGKSSAMRRKIEYPWKEDDLYKTCLNIMLANCEYVAAIIPESFITAGIHKDRLFGIISLTFKMFDDTDCPVCLAMFTPYENANIKIYSGEEFLGTMHELQSISLTGNTSYHKWVFNDKEGSIGVKTVDGTKVADCRFFCGENIDPNDIKVSSRSFTRVKGLPKDIDREKFFSICNNILDEYRKKTKDVLMTSFKGLRSDGKYRRRLDFRTVKCILNEALIKYETL